MGLSRCATQLPPPIWSARNSNLSHRRAPVLRPERRHITSPLWKPSGFHGCHAALYVSLRFVFSLPWHWHFNYSFACLTLPLDYDILGEKNPVSFIFVTAGPAQSLTADWIKTITQNIARNKNNGWKLWARFSKGNLPSLPSFHPYLRRCAVGGKKKVTHKEGTG